MRGLLACSAVSLVLLAGCGSCGTHDEASTVPPAPLELTDDATTDARIAAATRRATDEGKRVLLVFVAEHDSDTQLVLRFLAEEPAASALARGYAHVFVDLGSGPVLHPALRHRYDVTAAVTFVVLDPLTSRRIARRVFAPATGTGTVTAASLAEWLDAPRGR